MAGGPSKHDRAVTGFALQFGDRLLDRPYALFLVVGIIALIMGMAGVAGSTNHWLPLAASPAGWVVMVIGIGLTITGVVLNVVQANAPLAAHGDGAAFQRVTSKIKILSPKDGTLAGEREDIVGSIGAALPLGYSLEIVRIFNDDSFTPLGPALVSEKTWRFDQAAVGGKPGDRRWIGTFIVGRAGRLFLEHHSQSSKVHNRTMSVLEQLGGGPADYLPNIKVEDFVTAMPDVVEGHRIGLLRR